MFFLGGTWHIMAFARRRRMRCRNWTMALSRIGCWMLDVGIVIVIVVVANLNFDGPMSSGLGPTETSRWCICSQLERHANMRTLLTYTCACTRPWFAHSVAARRDHKRRRMAQYDNTRSGSDLLDFVPAQCFSKHFTTIQRSTGKGCAAAAQEETLT